MIIYSKYLEDNIDGVFNREMDEYKKYVKMFYDENSRCPGDSKTILEKEENREQIRLWCKMRNGKVWNALISKPLVLNLNIRLNELSNNYNNKCILFKDTLIRNLSSSVYNPDKDKDIEKKLIELKEEEKELESLREVFDKEREKIDDILEKRKLILKNLLEIKIKKNNIFEKCTKINAEIKRKLMEITNNEKDITVTRIEQIAKNVSLKADEVRSWIEYFRYIISYLQENASLDDLNKQMMILKNKYDRINSFFIIKPPVIEITEGGKKLLEKSIVKPVELIVKETVEKLEEDSEVRAENEIINELEEKPGEIEEKELESEKVEEEEALSEAEEIEEKKLEKPVKISKEKKVTKEIKEKKVIKKEKQKDNKQKNEGKKIVVKMKKLKRKANK